MTDPDASADPGGSTGRMRLLQAVVAAASQATNVASALRTCLEQVCAHTGWQVGHAYLLDDEAGDLKPTAIWHLTDEARFASFKAITEATRFAPGEGMVGGVLVERRPEWVPDVMRSPGFLRARHGAELGIRAGLVFPVLMGDAVVGVLEFYSTAAAEADQALLEVMAQIGIHMGSVVSSLTSAPPGSAAGTPEASGC